LKDIFDHLENGTLEVTGRLVDASNATLYATCTYEGEAIPVIYKPIAGERPLWDFPDGNLAQREYAAFLISELAQFHLVPPTLLRDGPFGPGMVQQWIDIDESIDLAQFYRTDDSRLRAMALFDAIINNTDRKIGHLLPHPDGRLLGCDHGVTFHEEDKLRTVLWQWADSPLSDDEKSLLSNLKEKLLNDSEAILALITDIEF
jgi:uncharacterized repeat protein (TIGR03843 family)